MSRAIATRPSAPAADPAVDAAIDAVRRFNRFHTRLVGALDAPWLDSGLSLAQVRVLYELAHRDAPAASDLATDLGLDAGYLSRMLEGFRARGWMVTAPAPEDGRRRLLKLTAAGRRAFEPMQRAARAQVGGWLAPMAALQRRALVDAMATVESLLGAASGTGAASAPARAGPVVLRAHRPGDLGWVVSRHGALYAQEYGWDVRFEAMVAGIVATFGERFDPARERCWIAERDGERLGSVFVVSDGKRTAKLRMLLVEPSARGLGLGRQLVREAVTFARDTGYRRMVLWTNDVLVAARGIYRDEGFVLERSESHDSFGKSMVGEYWSLAL